MFFVSFSYCFDPSLNCEWVDFLVIKQNKKLTNCAVLLLCSCSKFMGNFLAPWGTAVHHAVPSCVAMATKLHTHTWIHSKLGMQVKSKLNYDGVSLKHTFKIWGICWVFEPNDEILESGEETQTRRELHKVHIHFNEDVNCTFVSRTDMILSLASLTLSLFPHTLMCGSAGEKKKKDCRDFSVVRQSGAGTECEN